MDLSEPDDTLPNTPEDFSDVTALEAIDAFALLRPVSSTAQNAFNASINYILKHAQQSDEEHYRQFLHAKRAIPRAPSIYSETEDASAEEYHAEPASKHWNGAFKFSLRKSPRDAKAGWYLGVRDGKSRPPHQGVDLLLAPPTREWIGKGISESHARLYFHPESYRMVLQARHTVVVGHIRKTIRNSQIEVLNDPDLIVLDNFVYSFEYTSHFRSPEFEAELSDYLKKFYEPQRTINKLLSPVSIGAPTTLGKYYCSPKAFAQGTFGEVIAGWTRDGSSVAIKHFKNPNERKIQAHEELMQIIGEHPNVLQLLDCIAAFQGPIPTAHCIYSPLALMTLRDVINSFDTNTFTQHILFENYLSGLSYLHGKGIMHRDMKPENMAVLSFHDPRGVLLDLDAATASLTSADHMQGTVSYLAPEIIALKDCRPSPYAVPVPYDKSVDIWALGLSMFAFITSRPWSWRYFQGERGPDIYSELVYDRFLAHLIKLTKSGDTRYEPRRLLFNSIGLMTKRHPQERKTASALLELARSDIANFANESISITPKRTSKHRLEEENPETRRSKRPLIG